MSMENDVRFHPDRALAYARWLLSRDQLRLDEDERQIVDWLRDEGGQGILKILEDGEREMLADERTRAYYRYLTTVHAVCLRVFGQMLPQRIVQFLWYAWWSLLLLVGVGAAWWWLVRPRR